MSSVKLGNKVPDFTLPATGGGEIRLSDLRGKAVVIYFYPKDSTPGCTQEGQDFRDLYEQFQTANARILGVSRDSVAAHERFKAKHGFPFDLLSDAEETVCRLFDVIKPKNLYGKKVVGVERSTFVIDPAGVLRHEQRKVKVAGHADEILNQVRALQTLSTRK